MLIPIVAGIGAGLFMLLTDSGEKKKTEGGAAPKTFDEGVAAGREAADKEHKTRAAERRRIEKIAAKQAMLYSRVAPKAPLDDDDGGES